MEFKGLVFTDALNMKGVTKYYKPGEIESLAFKAGNDILLFPVSVSKAISKIKKQVRKGEISRERIDESCRKVLEAKSDGSQPQKRIRLRCKTLALRIFIRTKIHRHDYQWTLIEYFNRFGISFVMILLARLLI